MSKKKINFKESVGLDIGSHSVKIVHLKRLQEGFKLLNYEIRPTVPQGIEYSPSDLRDERYGPIISEMLRTLRIKPRKIKRLVSAVGGDHVSIKQIKTIFLPDDELDSALFFEAKKHLPISGSEMVLDYQVLNIEEKTNNMNILLTATNKEYIQKHTNILSSVDLVPNIIDAEPLAVANSFALNSFVEDGAYIMLNIGAHKTIMSVYSPIAKFFARDLAWGGFNFTKDIMKKKDIPFEEAEEYKYENGILGKKEKSQQDGTSLSTLEVSDKSTQEQLALEVKRSLRFYVKEAGNSDFRKVLLVGGGAKLKGLPEYFEENLNIPTEIYNPYVNLEMPEKFKDKRDPQLALAIGLAMRTD